MSLSMIELTEQQGKPASQRKHEECTTKPARLFAEWQGVQSYIVDRGYCSNTGYLEKLQQKEMQYSAWHSALKS